MLKLKLFIVAAFLAFAVCAFLFPNNKIEAQTSEAANKRNEILEKVAGYKIWKQVQKPEKKIDSAFDLVEAKADALPILDSTAMG